MRKYLAAVKRVPEYLKPFTPPKRAWIRILITVFTVTVLLIVLSRIAKVALIYEYIKSVVMSIAAAFAFLLVFKHTEKLLFLYRPFRYTVIALISLVLGVFGFMVCWYCFCFFPEDQSYLQRVVDSVQVKAGNGEIREKVEHDLVRNIRKVRFTNPLDGSDMEFLLSDDLAAREFYIDKNPFGDPRSSNNLKYATGRIFYYTSQKNCIVMKGGSSFNYNLNRSSGSKRFLELDFAFPSFNGESAPGTIEILFHQATARTLLTRQVDREIKPDIAPFRYSNVLSSISFYLKHPGRSVLTDNTGWNPLRVEIPNGAGKLEIRFSGSQNNRDYLFLGTPRIITHLPIQNSNDMNVVYLIYDTLSKSHLDVYQYFDQFQEKGYENALVELGPRRAITPDIDKSAKRMLVFDNMYTVGQVTRPAIIPLWTSTFYTKSRMPVFRNIVTPENRNEYHSERHPSLPDMLSKEGYFTKQISCNAQGHGVSGVGVDLGFDENYDYTMEASEYTENTKRIIEFLEQNQSRKFLLYAHINVPHPPRWIPLSYYLKSLWETDFNHSTAVMLGNIRYLNDSYGKISRALHRLKLNRNTIVIITADHSGGIPSRLRGYVTDDEINLSRRASMSVADFTSRSIYVRKGGPELFRTTMNIPFLVIPPDNSGFKPGKISATISSLDISPTILDVLTGKQERAFEGKSFKKILYGENNRQGVFSPFIPMLGRFQRAFLLEGRFKYWIDIQGLYRYRDGEKGKKYIMQQEYLFDLVNDPYETDNLALDHKNPALLKRMRETFTEKFVEYPDKNFLYFHPGGSPNNDVYSAQIKTSGAFKYINVYDGEIDYTVQNNNVIIARYIGNKRGILSFETSPPDSALNIQLFNNDRPLSRSQIFSCVENINFFSNPVILKDKDDFFVARIPGKTGLEEKPLPAKSVSFFRIPLEYWLEMSRSEKDIRLSPGIKEVLRGWGYIQ